MNNPTFKQTLIFEKEYDYEMLYDLEERYSRMC